MVNRITEKGELGRGQPKRQLLLLPVIYLAFVSLGLPDSITGVAWPFVRADFGLPLESMGVLTTVLLILSSFSSFVSGRVIGRLGTGGLTFLSGAATGLALLGYAFSRNLAWMLICAVPLGLGQGAVDSGLNRYVAQHYSARHMSWLHCFWGVGASAGPLIMTGALVNGNWRGGYAAVAVIQLVLAAVLLLSLTMGLWQEKPGVDGAGREDGSGGVGLSSVADQAMATALFFLYSGVEFSIGTWLYSLLVESRRMPVAAAGAAVSAYYAAVMAGRFFSGFVVNRVGNVRMIRLGLTLAVAGGLCAWLLRGPALTAAGVVLIGLGLAPVYPCLMHETPRRFIRGASGRLIGYQVGAACLGGSIISAGGGMLFSLFSLELLFPLVLALIVFTCLGNEILARRRAALPVQEGDSV